jgi:putative aldouronate transport system permease protein
LYHIPKELRGRNVMESKLTAVNVNEEIMKKAEKRQLIKKAKRYKALYIMMIPTIIYVIVLSYLPMFGIIVAFKDLNYADGILGSPWNGLRNFEFLFRTTDAWVITRNTVLYNVVFIILGLLSGVTIAVSLNELINKRLGKFYQASMVLPHFLSAIVVSYILLALLGENYGFVNKTILPFFGKDAVNWYAEAKHWPLILPMVRLWQEGGFGSIVYLAAITGIDGEYFEAAVIDGATKWQQIKYITLPLLKPVMIILTILAIGRIFYADFGLFYNVPMDSGPLYPATNVVDTYVYRALTQLGDFGMASAAGLYQSIVGFILVLGANLAVRKIDPDNALF